MIHNTSKKVIGCTAYSILNEVQGDYSKLILAKSLSVFILLYYQASGLKCKLSHYLQTGSLLAQCGLKDYNLQILSIKEMFDTEPDVYDPKLCLISPKHKRPEEVMTETIIKLANEVLSNRDSYSGFLSCITLLVLLSHSFDKTEENKIIFNPRMMANQYIQNQGASASYIIDFILSYDNYLAKGHPLVSNL